jgi:hypothetical protein
MNPWGSGADSHYRSYPLAAGADQEGFWRYCIFIFLKQLGNSNLSLLIFLRNALKIKEIATLTLIK